jgi:sugar lactone lactonase YvrE
MSASSIAPQLVAGSSKSNVFTGQRDHSAKNVLYVSNLLSNVTVFPASIHDINPQPLETITNGTTRPEGMWVDRNGTLYVVNGVSGRNPVSVAEYKRGKISPDRLLEKGLVAPTAVAVGLDGTVYVNDAHETTIGVVVVYGPGQSRPERTITLPDPAYALEPGGMAFDANGSLLAATLAPENNAVHVFRIAPTGSSLPVDLGLQGAGGAAIAVDRVGNLYTASTPNDNGNVAVYAPGSRTPSRTFQLGPQINFITVAGDGTLYAAVLDQRTGVTGVAEVAPGANTITNLIDKNNYAYGVALGSL